MSAIGIAGVGAMGLPMAERLIAAGHEVWGFDVRPKSEFGAFASRMVDAPVDFAGRCGIVFSVVRDERETMDLLFDDQAIMTANKRPSLVTITSTLSPKAIARIMDRLPDGTALIDAPMSGAPYRAEDGTLTWMVGGAEEDIAKVTALFKIMGKEVHHLGPLGAGMTVKVLNNLVSATTVAVVRRALAAAAALGVSQNRLLNVMSTSSGGTWFGNNFDRIAFSRQGYDPDNTIGILEKDVSCFIDAVSDVPGHQAGALEAAVIAQLRKLEPME